MRKNEISRFQIWVTALGFLGLLFVPSIAWVFCHEAIGEDTGENRKLAEMPEFSLSIISTLPDRVEKAYNDHVPFRKTIRAAWTSLNLFALHDSTNEEVVIGKNDGSFAKSWLFYAAKSNDNPIKDVQGIKTFSEQDLEATLVRIQKETEKYKQRGINLYYLVAPSKESIYREMLPATIEIYKNKTRTEELSEYLEAKGIKNYYFAYKDMMKAKDLGQLYYRQDTHWNQLGSFIGFKGIMDLMNKNVTLADVSLGNGKAAHDLSSMLGVSWYFKDETFKVTYEAEKIDKSIVIIGDSYRTALAEYLEKTFARVVSIHRSDYKKGIIEKVKPDIVIYEFVERASDAIKDFAITLE